MRPGMQMQKDAETTDRGTIVAGFQMTNCLSGLLAAIKTPHREQRVTTTGGNGIPQMVEAEDEWMRRNMIPFLSL